MKLVMETNSDLIATLLLSDQEALEIIHSLAESLVKKEQAIICIDNEEEQ